MKTILIILLTVVFFTNSSFLGKDRGYAITAEIVTPEASDSVICKTISILKKRLKACHVKSTITLSGDKKSIRIHLKKISDTSLCKEYLLRPGRLRIQETYRASDILPVFLEINELLEQDPAAYPFSIPAFPERKNEFSPLDHILIFPFDYAGNPWNDASLGFALASDTALLNSIFNYPGFAGKFPPDLHFKWDRFPHDNWYDLYVIKDSTSSGIITQEMLLSARPAKNQGMHQVHIKLKEDYHALWAAFTRDNTGKFIVFVIDNEVFSAPMVVSEIPEGRGGIAGNMSKIEVNALAAVLNSGPLPLDIRVR
ncbi:MAG: SecDF P1 head subdomain-containing protein [Bacteroidia bacterium]